MQKRIALVAVLFASLVASAQALPVISHTGDADPTTEGWTFVPGNGSVGASTFDSEAVWQVTDGATGVAANHYAYALTPADLSGNWKIAARFGGLGHVNEDEVAILFRDGTRQYQFTLDEVGGGRFRNRQGLGVNIYTTGDSATELHRFTISSSPSDPNIHFRLDGGSPFSIAKTSIGFAVLGNETLEFGGFGGNGDARTGFWQFIEFNDGVAPPVLVAEPSTGVLLGLGAVAVAIRAGSRKRTRRG
jgi:hypothetical protein